MQNRRTFLKDTGALALCSIFITSFEANRKKIKNPGIQLYTVRKEMLEDATGTLKKFLSHKMKTIIFNVGILFIKVLFF